MIIVASWVLAVKHHHLASTTWWGRGDTIPIDINEPNCIPTSSVSPSLQMRVTIELLGGAGFSLTSTFLVVLVNSVSSGPS